MKQILIILVIVLLLFGLRWLFKQPPSVRWKWLIGIISAGLLGLVAVGKAHWIAAVIGTALPFLRRFWLLLRYMPFLASLSGRAGFKDRNIPRFESEWLRLEFNIVYRRLDGFVLKGNFKGKRLSQMRDEELGVLLQTLRQNDRKGAMLLQSYLVQARMRGAANQGAEREEQVFAKSQKMTVAEALLILGVTENASKEEIVKAYKVLMQRLHPDRGGSNYLAEKINLAKKTLLSH